MLNYSGNTAAEYNNIFFRHIFTQFQDLPGQVLTCTWDPGITHYPRITHYAAAWLITEMLPLHLCPVDSSYHIQHGIVVTDFAVYTTRYDCHCRISWRYSQGCVATRFNRIRVLLLDNDLGKQKKEAPPQAEACNQPLYQKEACSGSEYATPVGWFFSGIAHASKACPYILIVPYLKRIRSRILIIFRTGG